MFQSSRAHWKMSVLFVLLRCVKPVAGNQDDDSMRETAPGDDSYEQAVISIFSLLFSICISLVAVTLAYYFAIEGALLRRFLEKGVYIPAKVLQASFVRPTVHGTECNITVEYRYNMDDFGDDVSGTYKYATVLRKQIRCVDRDVYKAALTATKSKTYPSTPSRNRRVCIEVAPQILDSPLPISTSASDVAMDVSAASPVRGNNLNAFPSFDVAIFEEPQPHSYVDVLVLPGHPHSAIVSQHVERIVHAGQRQCTNRVLLASLSTLTFLGVYLGLGSARSTLSDVELLHLGDARFTWGLSLAVTVMMLSIELLVLHTIGRNLFLEAVYQEYLHHDGAVQLKTDDETLYTTSIGETSSWKTPSRPSPALAMDRIMSLESLTI